MEFQLPVSLLKEPALLGATALGNQAERPDLVESSAENPDSGFVPASKLCRIQVRSSPPEISFLSTHDRALLEARTGMQENPSVPPEVQTQGGLLVDRKALAGIVKNLPESETAKFRQESPEGPLEIQAGESHQALLEAIPDPGLEFDFPKLPKFCEIPARDLALALERVEHALEPDRDQQYYMNGICMLRDSDGAFTVVATDSKRLASATIPTAKLVPGETGCTLVPGGNAASLLACLRKTPDEAKITLFLDPDSSDGKPGNAIFRGPGWELASSTITAGFPEYHKVIPKEKDWKNSMDLDLESIRASLSRVTAAAGEHTQLVLTSDNGDIRLELNSRIVASGDRARECRTEERTSIIVNHNSLRDILEQLDSLGSQRCTMRIVDPHSPCAFHETDSSNGTAYTFVVMPFRG